MTRNEYEQRMQRLDEQLRTGIELLQTAHRQQVRALELVWTTSAEEDAEIPKAGVRPAAQPIARAPARPPRRRAWELYNEVRGVLARVPEVFDRNHVCEQLGYEPDRGSLHRVLQELIAARILSLEARGEGRTPTRYRKTNASPREAEE